MESPAIILAVVMANALRQRTAGALVTGGSSTGALASHLPGHTGGGFSLRKVLHESVTDGAQLLLLGAMLVGLITGESGQAAMQPFTGDLFKGMLAFFLLDMGPLVHAGLALGLTFPLNILFGIPLYLPIAHQVLG